MLPILLVELKHNKKKLTFDVTDDILERIEEYDMSKEELNNWIRPIEDSLDNIEKYNGNHFIYGTIECIQQSDIVPYDFTISRNKDIEFKVIQLSLK